MRTLTYSRGFVSAVALTAAMIAVACLAPVRAHAFQTRKPVGTPFGSFSIAENLAVDQVSGNVYATDGGGDEMVNVYGPDGGAPVGGIPSQLSGSLTPAGSFKFSIYPAGVVVDNTCYVRGLTGSECAEADPADGSIYVSDGLDEVVDKFRINGANEFEYVCQFDGHGGIVGTSCLPEGGEPATRFNEPWGLAIDGAGDLYVTDWGSEAIYEYNNQGEEVGNFSSPLVGHPEYVAVDPNGTIYVQSYSTGDIVWFKRSSPTGPVEGEPAIVGHGSGGIAYDPFMHRVIFETGSQIEEVDAEGQLTGSFPQSPFERGLGVAYDHASDRVYAVQGPAGEQKIQTFGPRLTVPDATTSQASSVHPYDVTLNGTVNPLGTSSTYHFQYGLTKSYGSVTPGAPAGEANEPIPAQAEVTELMPNSTYHYRVLAENENGFHGGADQAFTTPAVAPVLGVTSVSNLTRAGALLHGTVNPEASSTSYHFAYIEDAHYEPGRLDPYANGASTRRVSLGSPFEDVPIEELVAGLKPDTTYHYALIGINPAGMTVGPDAIFTTAAPTPPNAVTGTALGVSQNGATITGTLDTSGLAVTYGFEIGTTTDYGPPTGLGALGAGANNAEVSLQLTGLQPGTTYHYRLTATNIDGTAYGEDRTFTTDVFANVLVTPPAPLPFVSVPTIAFPAEAKAPVVKKKTVAKKGKLKKKRAKKLKPKKKLKSKKR
jgi:hypothetical protein